MQEKREWRTFDSTRRDLPKSGSRRSAGNAVPGLFAGATQEAPSGDEKLTKKLSSSKLDKSYVRVV